MQATGSQSQRVLGSAANVVAQQATPRNSSKDWEALDYQWEREFQVKREELAPLAALLRANRPDSEKLRATAETTWAEGVLKEPVPPSYTGPHLAWPLTRDCVVAMIQHFKRTPDVPLHKRYVVELFVKMREHLWAYPDLVRTISIHSGSHKQLVIVGDLHGQLADLLAIFALNGLPSPEGSQFLFNGDFVDRGDYGVEIICILFALKLLYPDTVHLNRGNHEDDYINRRDGFGEEMALKYGKGHLFNLCMGVFKYLPLCTIVDNTVFVVHGGLPRFKGITIGHLREIPPEEAAPGNPRTQTEYLMMDLLWNDPRPTPGMSASDRGPLSMAFGPDITRGFLQENGLRMVVRSHEVPEGTHGYQLHHENRVVTVFSASNYCGSTGNQAAVAIFADPGHYTFKEYYAPPLDQFLQWEATQPPISGAEIRSQAALNAEEKIVRQILEKVAENRHDIYWYLNKVDTAGTGKVTVTQWQNAMTNVLRVTLPWERYQSRLIQLTADGMVDYKQLVDRTKFDCDDKFASWKNGIRRSLHDAFLKADLSLAQIRANVDLNSDGTVDEGELVHLLSRMSLGVTPQQARELLRGLPQGPGSRGVDVMAFIESLRMEREFPPEVEQTLQFLGGLMMRNPEARRKSSMVNTFLAFDKDGDGKVQYSEFATAIRDMLADPSLPRTPELDHWSLKLDSAFLFKLASAIDANESGSIDYVEFVDALKRSTKCAERHDPIIQHICNTLHMYRFSLDKAFELMDADGDGFLSPQEFADGLRAMNTLLSASLQLSSTEIELVARHVDLDGDGRIDWAEFLQAFRLDSEPIPPEPPSVARAFSCPPSSMGRSPPRGGYSA